MEETMKMASRADVQRASLHMGDPEHASQAAAESELQRVCVVLLATDPADRLLLVRNKKRGGWELPGGKKRPYETWRDAARREGLEEAGLDMVLALGAPYDVLDGLPVPGASYASTIIVVRARAEGTPVAGDDAAEARWFEVDQIPWDDLSKIGSRVVVERWSYSVLGEVVRLSPTTRLAFTMARTLVTSARGRLLCEEGVDRVDSELQLALERLRAFESMLWPDAEEPSTQPPKMPRPVHE